MDDVKCTDLAGRGARWVIRVGKLKQIFIYFFIYLIISYMIRDNSLFETSFLHVS